MKNPKGQKTISIRRNILIPVILLTLSCSIAMTIIFVTLSNRELSNKVDEQINVASMTAENKIENYRSSSRMAAIIIAENPLIIEAVKSNDHNKVLSVAKSQLDSTDVDFVAILDSEGIVLARTHAENQYGDDLSVMLNAASALEGEVATAVARSTFVALSVSTSAPIFDENESLVGVAVVGYRLDTNNFVQALKDLTGCEVTIFLGDERISTTIIDESGEYAIGTKVSEDVSAQVFAGEPYVGKAMVLDRAAIAKYTPLYGLDDNVIGMLFVGKYSDELAVNLISSGAWTMLLVSIGSIIVALIISALIARRLEKVIHFFREKEKLTQLYLDASPFCVTVFNKDFQVINTNDESAKLFDLASKQEYCERFFDLSPEYQPDGTLSHTKAFEHITEAFESGFRRFEWMHQKLNGEPIPCEITLDRVKHLDNYSVVGFTHDLRETKAALAEKLKALDERNALVNIVSIMNGIDALIYVTDPETDELLFVNDKIKRIFNITDESLGKPCYKVLQKGKNARCAFCPSSQLKSKPNESFIWEEYNELTNRVFRNIDSYIDWPNGKKVHLQQSVDITETKTLLTKLNLTVAAGHIGLWDTMVNRDDPKNPNNPFTWSDEFRHMFGFSDENDFPNVFGSFVDRLHPNDRERTLESFEKHLLDTTGETPYDVEYCVIKKDGEYAYFRAFGKTMRDDNGNPIQVAGAIMDVSKEKELQQKLLNAALKEQEANMMKSSFLTNMSHEIRTPMNAILGATEIQLENKALPAETEEALNRIYESGSLLMGIINDILDLSKIEAGKLDLVPITYDVPSLINDVVQLNILRNENKPIEFVLNLDENVPLNLCGDEIRIKQILNNIISNAFKYTEKGTVSLSIFTESVPDTEIFDEISDTDSDAEGFETVVVFRVCDTGQGMTEAQVEKLFDEYTRFNMEANRSTVGTGLGMSITKRLVDLMSGEILVESQPGKGSEFTVRLTQKQIGNTVCGKELADKLRSFRFHSKANARKTQIQREYMPYGSVLVVDDVESNIYVIRGLLLPYGLTVETASNGLEAIEKINAGNVYDIVFMDHLMPKLDGIEATKIIRDTGYTESIVALTANAIAGQAELFMKNGFDGFVSKPIDSYELNATLNEFIRDKKPPEVVEAARSEQKKQQKQGNGAGAGALSADVAAGAGVAGVPTTGAAAVAGSDAPSKSAAVSPLIAKHFILDAEKAINVFDEFMKLSDQGDADMELFNITVHGIKSAFTIIGETELAAVALKLEQASAGRNLAPLLSEAPALIDSLKSLVDKFKSM